jgi:hypothetical protein
LAFFVVGYFWCAYGTWQMPHDLAGMDKGQIGSSDFQNHLRASLLRRKSLEHVPQPQWPEECNANFLWFETTFRR